MILPSPSTDQNVGSKDSDFAAAVFQRYSKRLAALADGHLSQKLKSRVDGEDIAQSALRTFFRRSAEGQFKIDDSTHLWNLLVSITLNKVRHRARFHQAEGRDVRREETVIVAAGSGELESPEPQPEDAVIVADLVDHALFGLPEVCGDLVSLLLAGHTKQEVAQKLGVSRMTVYRLLDLVESRLGRAGS